MDLSRNWVDLPLCFIDTETTGLPTFEMDPGTGELFLQQEICEIAAVRFEGQHVAAEYASLIKPTRPIPDEATKIHGITNAMVEQSPCIEEAASGICKVALAAIPAAFNAPFDRQFLHSRVQGTDCPAFDPLCSWLDVYTIVASPRIDKYQSGKGRLKLSACCARHGVAHESQHRAHGDALATGKLLWRLHEKGLVKVCSAERLLQWGAVRRNEQDADSARYRARLAKGAA